MEYFEDSLKTIGNQTQVNEIKNFSSSLYCSVMNSLMGLDISQFPTFNLKNAAVMRYHMKRNDVQKSLIRSGFGENAYVNGNSEIDGTSSRDYSYAIEQSYRQFSSNIPIKERSGYLITGKRDFNGKESEYFFDYVEHLGGYKEETPRVASLGGDSYSLRTSGDIIEKDSILYKTRQLFNANKIKSIISQFHTDNVVKYNGQVGSVFGESHGRNLLTKEAEERGVASYSPNGYDNPYCRVWTHHYKYDRFSKTLRANKVNDIKDSINYWGNEFEWNSEDVGHSEDKSKYGDGENYDYAWRGHHNQERRRRNSVLDETTGLVKIVPKYNGGGDKNIHTKACMFSIENLAWKDYDPYSFEQALSWEQRGPLGGRIMWFPPYNLKVNESNTANWNKNDFIGRGEPVYTYVNSDRSGTLTFTMLVDHPSSIDYSSWHDDSGIHKDNDYHRYFAGCFGDKTMYSGRAETPILNADKTKKSQQLNGNNGGDNLLELPPYLTDEYDRSVPNLIKAKELVNEPEEPIKKNETVVEKDPPSYVEFYVFFPNNYSGFYDYPTVADSNVDSIMYLLRGIGAQKKNGYTDIPINKNTTLTDTVNCYKGYEMFKGQPLGKKGDGNYLVGIEYNGNNKKYIPSKSKKWYYRIDTYLKKEGVYGDGELDSTNCIGQKLTNDDSYVDLISYGFNNSIDWASGDKNDNLYSFAEVACAMYSETLLDNKSMYLYLVQFTNQDRVEKLIKIFSNLKLNNITCFGTSNEQGNNEKKEVNDSRNKALANNRAETVVKWLKLFNKFKDVKPNTTPYPGLEVSAADKNNESGKTAKLNRSAHVKLEFTSIDVKSESQTDNTQTETVDESRTNDTAPVIGKEFNEKNWIKLIPDNISTYLNSQYHYTGEDNPDINDLYAVTWRESRTPIKWALYHYENNSLAQVSVVFNNYIGIFDKDYQYKKNDVCFYNNEFYASKYFFLNDMSEYQDEDGNQLKLSRGNEYKEYYGFDYIGSKYVDGKSKWDYYLKKPGLIYFEEDNSINDNSTVANGSQTSQDEIELTEKQIKQLVNFGVIAPTNDKFDENNLKYRGEFDVLYDGYYKTGDIVFNDGKYYVCLYDLETKYPKHSFNTSEDEQERDLIEWNQSDWEEVKAFNYYDMFILEKCAQLLCISMDEFKKETKLDGIEYTYSSKTDEEFSSMYCNYGCDINDSKKSFNNLYTNSKVINKNVDIYSVAESNIGSIYDKEATRLSKIYGEKSSEISIYISLYNILKNVDYISDDLGNRKPACKTEGQVNKLMTERKNYDENSKNYENDCNNIWVDRGDGLLIQECELKEGKDKSGIKDRGDSLNKLRYDQEYHFYKQYFEDHPFVFQELREKIKYFNPAFHSMTPEGFNGRLTFLNQCTRQGATMTRSDALAGTTANNLAFGRPPYCVLRLGDFYHQLIVIESINYNFDVSGGLQWDLNPEGNGVQPMLCEVSISFKFIGGGDITGPVRRLQNAMSFNYYANTSFYDNRADRHEYEHNVMTMGGAGNNKVDTRGSYSYTPALYDDRELVNITKF